MAVRPGSPAAAAGLQAGDVVLRVQSAVVRGAAELEDALRAQPEGRVVLSVVRGGWEKDVLLDPPPHGGGEAWFGILLSDAIPDAGGSLPPGAVVTRVAEGGPAARAGLRPGDTIASADGNAVSGVESFVAMLSGWPLGRPLRIGVVRDGWRREFNLMPMTKPTAVEPGAAFVAASPATTVSASPPPPVTAAGRGTKALVAVGDFRVKAATASATIGDGLREMLVTTLFNSGTYIVVERMDLQGLAAEQALSRSRMAREGAAMPERQMDVADIMIYGAVTEFEGAARGSSVKGSAPSLPFAFGRDTSKAHMAIDVRIVEVATGRILGAQRIVGDARSSQTALAGTPRIDGTAIPASLGVFSNTPMEQAIRDCVARAVAYVGTVVPTSYFIHQ